MIIITAKVHSYLTEALDKKGCKYLYLPQIAYSELENIIADAEGLIVTTRLQIDKNIIQKATNLKWIGRLGSGMELIDVAYASSKGIKCVSSPEGNSNAVAEHALGLLLALFRNITRSSREVAEGKWLREPNRGIELNGKTVGIIGFGNTGSSFAKLLSAFNVTVLAYDKFRFGFGGGYIKEATLEQVCRYSDVISFHVPLTADTMRMASGQLFNLMSAQPFLINTSRGGVIDTAALITALKAGRLKGAALDVLENEEIDRLDSRQRSELEELLSMNNVILTPHIAGYTHEAFLNMSTVLLQKLDL